MRCAPVHKTMCVVPVCIQRMHPARIQHAPCSVHRYNSLLGVRFMLEMRSARAAQGILDAKGRKTLSAANFYCFIPALTFTKLATAVDLHNIRQWWFLPVNVLLGISLGMLLGWLFTWVAKPLFPAKLRRHVMCAVALGAHVLHERATLLPQRLHALRASACRRACALPGNIGNLPMVLVAGLCGNAASLLLPSQPTADACSEVSASPASLRPLPPVACVSCCIRAELLWS